MSSESVPASSSSLSAPLPPLTRIAIIVVAVYAMVQLLADLASLKIGVVFGLAVDMGTFIYPVTFTLRDLAHKVLGRRRARVLIVTAAAMNFFAVLYLIACAAVPSDEGWGLGEQFSAIFSPIWRIVFAAVVAQVVSQLVNTEVYHWFATRVTKRYQWLRVLVSNSVAIPVDNIIFVLGA
ncbi:MAG: queuosine precursor transporter, partial [Kiritimatiellia bacterium]